MSQKEREAQKKLNTLTQRQARLASNKSKLKRQIKNLKVVTDVLPLSEQASIVTEDFDDLEGREVIFKPHPGPQTEFLAATEQEVLFGGAAGGGKSYAIIADPLRYCPIPDHRAIIFRRTNDELRELIFKSQQLYPRAFPGAKWQEQKSQWTFPSGAIIWYTYLDKDQDVLRYQGQAFNHISFDELTQWPTPFAWDYMRSRLRSTNPDLPLYQRATANPGNVGGWWVRKMFIDPAPPNTSFVAQDLETGQPLVYPRNHSRSGEPLFSRRFIPSRLQDNPSLYEDGRYEANLLGMPEVLRKQLLDGDWDVSADGAFPEFDKKIHVVEPFAVPNSWFKFRAADWGYRSPACVLWMAVDPDNTLYVYREYYGKGLTADTFSKKILELEDGDTVRYGIMDSSVWSMRGEVGPPIPEIMLQHGLSWRKADRSKGSRKNGKLEVHRRLQLDEYSGEPKLKIFNTCGNLIRTLGTLPIDKNNPEDVDTQAEDHAYDALRYGVMSRPVNPMVYSEAGQYFNSYQPYVSDTTFGY